MDRQATARSNPEDLGEMLSARSGSGQPDDLVVNVVL